MANPPDPLLIAALQQASQPQGNPVPQPPATAPPVLAGSPGSAEAQNNSVRPGRPLLLDAMQKLIKPPMVAPAPGQMARPVSRLDTFENFLGNFLSAFGQGMQQSGQRGAEFKGFGAAVQGPRQLTMQNQALQNQTEMAQAEAAQRQATAGLVNAQAQPVQVPLGPNGEPITVPAGVAGNVYRGAPAAQIRGQSSLGVAGVQAQNRLDVTRLQMQFAQMKAGKFIPDRDPNTGQLFYHVMNPFGQQIGTADVSAIPQLMQRMSSTVDFKQQEDGSYVALPKSTKSGPVFNTPLGAAVGGAKGLGHILKGNNGNGRFWATSSPNGMTAVPVLGRDGKPLFGKAPDNIRTMAYTAKATLPHIDELNQEVSEMQQLGVLGQFKGKMSQALAGRGFRIPGLSDAQMQAVGKFLNDVKLTDSAMLRTHFGARGGQEMYEKFSDMLNAGEDPNLIKGGLASFKDFLTGYSQMGGMNPQGNASPSNASPSGKSTFWSTIPGAVPR